MESGSSETSGTVESLAGFVERVSGTADSGQWLFRGHADADWPLIPALARIRPVEDTIRAAERWMMSEFKRFAAPHLPRLPRSEWDWLALAQHHGIPTRLLDWTTNPLAALFFAVAESRETSSAVWMYRYARSQRTEGVDPYEIDDVHVLRPTHSSRRIVGQSGYFTAHPMPLRPFDAMRDQHEQLRKLSVPVQSRHRLRAELDRVGVNYATLFPDLDGVARHIRWSASVAEDEERYGTRRPFGGRVDSSQGRPQGGRSAGP